MSGGEIVVRNPSAIAERVGGDLVVLDLEQDRYVRLNGSGAALWEALAEPQSVEALAARLVAAGAPSARAAVDAAAFVRALAERSLVELRP